MVRAAHCPILIGAALLDKLLTTMHAILVPITPPLRMLCFAAFLEDNVLVYHFAAVRTVPDGGVRALVIHVWT